VSTNVAIHRTAIVAPDVEVGAGTTIGPYAVVVGPCRIGEQCWIGPHCVVGTTGEDTDVMVVPKVPSSARLTDDDDTRRRLDEELWFGRHGEGIIIGDRTIIRELSAVQQGTVRPTVIGSDVFLMDKSHIAHDNHIGDGSRIAPYVAFAGHVSVGSGATIGMGSAIHQFRALGAGVMVGMNSTITKDVRPYELVIGSPARAKSLNFVGLERAGHSAGDIADLQDFYAGNRPEPPRVFTAAIAAWENDRRV